ncbi:MFS transporter [Halothermothrix orenii]|uniref:Major facilitator superfamily MFS_1 n=1 Tax=Halothermothrix orenii (strain H 168 / OCM 544 / DSM 9562) TaxID=373903 RepID=B8D0I6_HALOH|nr:MFS transporter [Halothermothrix orenii]ACL70922.1 major facilitator superfamily MFS_1 [Halothermothrix orenii H 168]
MKSKYKLMMVAFSGVPFIMVLGNSMLIPEFPQIKAALDIDQFHVGLLITVFSISAGITIPFLGYLCDQIGRIKVIVPSLLLYGLGGIISGVAALIMDNPYNIILIGRVVQGVGAAGTAPIVMALVGDIFQSEQRSEALGIIEAANGIGKVVSPILGSAIGLISWIALFFFYVFLAIPIAAGVWFWGKEVKEKGQQSLKKYLRNVGEIFKEKGLSLIMTILSGMLVLFILFGLLSYFSDFLEAKHNIKGFVKGLVIAIPILFMSTTSYINGYILKKVKKYFKASIITGLIIIPLALIILSFIKSLTTYLVLFSLLGIGTGLVLPAINTLVTSSTKADQRGVITSIYGSARFVGVAIGPPAFSFLEELSLKTMYYGGSLIAGIIMVLALIFISEKGMTPNQG